ncbi:MAG: TlpA family protein disulfide reductase [Vicinamibacterales bacterium]
MHSSSPALRPPALRRALACLLAAWLAAAPVPAAAADRFKPFSLRSAEGVKTSLADVQGRRATLVVFFFPTCGFCRAFVPEVRTLEAAYRDRGLSVVWINVVPKEDRLVADWRRTNGIGGAVLLGGRSAIRDYGVAMTPTHVLLDASGRVAARHAGFAPGDEGRLEPQVRALLDETP